MVRVGLDFDGVIVYNPFRVLRAPVAFFKKRFLKMKRLKFIVPQNTWQQLAWILIFESSIRPAKGIEVLKMLSGRKDIELHLVTARYKFLQNHLEKLLKRRKWDKLFKTINMNTRDEQPHLYKERIIKKYKFDYYIEDNWDIVKYLQGKTKAKVMWISNVTDSGIDYPEKYPYLEKALENIIGL